MRLRRRTQFINVTVSEQDALRTALLNNDGWLKCELVIAEALITKGLAKYQPTDPEHYTGWEPHISQAGRVVINLIDH